MSGIINNISNVNIGASYEELIPDWFGVTIWNGKFRLLNKIGIQAGIDIYQHAEYGGKVINWDVNKGLPFADESVSNIFCSHFIEHLSYTEALRYFKEVYRILKPGGIIRFICPDISIWIDKLYNGNDADFFGTYRSTLKEKGVDNKYYKHRKNLITNSQVFNSMFYNWGHKWMWDYESLKLELTNANFSSIEKLSKGVGSLYELEVIENRLPPDTAKARDLESLYVEAIK